MVKKIPSSQTNLPDKLSGLIDLALTEEENFISKPNRVIDMNAWLHIDYCGVCHACMAGVVMFSRVGVPHHGSIWQLFNQGDQAKFHALNYARRGAIDMALEEMGFQRPASIPYTIEFTQYKSSDDRVKWRREMRDFSARLKGVGL